MTSHHSAVSSSAARDEHRRLLLSRTRAFLRFLVPTAVLVTVVTSARVIDVPRGVVVFHVAVGALLTVALGGLLVGAEMRAAGTGPADRAPGLFYPIATSALVLFASAYLAILGNQGAGWGVYYTIGVFAVAGITPMPFLPSAVLFAAHLGPVVAAHAAAAESTRLAIVPIAGSVAISVLGMFVSFQLFRRSAESIHRNLILEDANARLHGAMQRNKRLLSIVSHDVRAPLGSIVQLFDFVEERRAQFGAEDMAQIMADVTASLRNAYQLLDNVLAWARSSSGETRVNRRAYGVEAIVTETIQPILLSARRKEISIRRSIDAGLEVVVDRRMLEVSLRNFMSNAVKFVGEGGTITIRGYQVGEESVAIEIIDDGIGMTRDEVARLFQESDHRTSRVGTAGEHGAGLGFGLACHFVELNSGRVEVESEPGRGTRVSCTVPGQYNPELARMSVEEQLPPET